MILHFLFLFPHQYRYSFHPHAITDVFASDRAVNTADVFRIAMAFGFPNDCGFPAVAIPVRLSIATILAGDGKATEYNAPAGARDQPNDLTLQLTVLTASRKQVRATDSIKTFVYTKHSVNTRWMQCRGRKAFIESCMSVVMSD